MKKILFIRFSSLGDIVLTESTIRLTKHFFPDFEIHYLTKEPFDELVKNFLIYENNNFYPLIDKVYLWKNKLKLLRLLNQEKYTYIVDLHSKFNSFIVKLATKSNYTIIWKKQHLRRLMMIKRLTDKHIDSVVWNYLNTLNMIASTQKNISLNPNEINSLHKPQLLINTQDADYKKVMDIFAVHNLTVSNIDKPEDFAGKYMIAIFPGAQHKTKQYPIEKMALFIDSIPEYWHCSFVIMGDYKEKDIAINLRRLTNQTIFDLTGAFNIKQLIYAINFMHAVISNDSGPMHIAAALNKPQIALYGATHTKLGFRPLNDNAEIIQKNLYCQPCSLHGSDSCPKNHFLCMKSIQTEELFIVFKKMFEDKVLRI